MGYAGLLADRQRSMFLLCKAAVIFVLLVLLITSFFRFHNGHVSQLVDENKLHKLTSDQGALSTVGAHDEEPLGVEDSTTEWRFSARRDARNFGLSQDQCNYAFPQYFQEIDRAVAWRQEHNQPVINDTVLDAKWRRELLRLMIYDGQVRRAHWTGNAFINLMSIALHYRRTLVKTWLRLASRYSTTSLHSPFHSRVRRDLTQY